MKGGWPRAHLIRSIPSFILILNSLYFLPQGAQTIRVETILRVLSLRNRDSFTYQVSILCWFCSSLDGKILQDLALLDRWLLTQHLSRSKVILLKLRLLWKSILLLNLHFNALLLLVDFLFKLNQRISALKQVLITVTSLWNLPFVKVVVLLSLWITTWDYSWGAVQFLKDQSFGAGTFLNKSSGLVGMRRSYPNLGQSSFKFPNLCLLFILPTLLSGLNQPTGLLVLFNRILFVQLIKRHFPWMKFLRIYSLLIDIIRLFTRLILTINRTIRILKAIIHMSWMGLISCCFSVWWKGWVCRFWGVLRLRFGPVIILGRRKLSTMTDKILI